MTRAKIIFIYTVLGVFVAVSIIGILAACGVIQTTGAATASALIGPCLGIVATVASAKHIFDDPEAITKLKQEHFDAMLALKRKLEDDKSEIRNDYVQMMDRAQLEYAAAIAKTAERHLKERAADKEAIAKCQGENQILRSQIPPPPRKMSPASGSAGTHRS